MSGCAYRFTGKGSPCGVCYFCRGERPRTSREVEHSAPAPLPDAGRLLSPEKMAEADCGPSLLEPARSGWIADRAAGYRRDRAAILARLDAAIALDDVGPPHAETLLAHLLLRLDALRAELRGAS